MTCVMSRLLLHCYNNDVINLADNGEVGGRVWRRQKVWLLHGLVLNEVAAGLCSPSEVSRRYQDCRRGLRTPCCTAPDLACPPSHPYRSHRRLSYRISKPRSLLVVSKYKTSLTPYTQPFILSGSHVAGNMLPVSRQHKVYPFVSSNRRATNWQQFCCRQQATC